MSGRIRHTTGAGSAGLSGGPGDRQGTGHDPARAARFRRTHRPGDTVHGTFLRPAAQSSAFVTTGATGGGLGWADIGGQTLLATMPAFPQPGTELLFRVERLEPDIVLRLLSEGEGPAVVPPSPARLAADYATARDRLDARLAETLFPAVTGAAHAGATRHAHLAAQVAAQVAEDAETAALFLACQRARLALLPTLRAAHPGVTLLHLPWLCPAARALDCAVLPPASTDGTGLVRLLLGGVFFPSGTAEVATGPSLPSFSGRFLLHGLLRSANPEGSARLAFRIMAESPGALDALLEPLAGGLSTAAVTMVLLSTGPLPAGPSDPLGLLLAPLHGGSSLLA